MNDKFKKIVFGTLFACSMPVFVACGGKQVLAQPTELSIDNTTYMISWKAVKNADYYVVEINGKTYQTTTTTFPASDIISAGGKFYVRVMAFDKDNQFLQSKHSDFVSIENYLAFETPVMSLQNNTISWTNVGADYYTLVVNGVKFITTSTSLDLTNIDPEIASAINLGKNNSFCVYAKATSNNLASELSNTIECYVADAQPAPSNLTVHSQGGQVLLSFVGSSTATSYTVNINNQQVVVTETTLDILPYLTNGFGYYDISVKCNKVEKIEDTEVTLLYMESALSNVLTYEFKPAFVEQKVQNLAIENGVLTFDKFDDARGYTVIVNDTQYQTTNNQFNLSQLSLPAGYHNISVFAYNGNYISLTSDEIEYKVTQVLSAPLLALEEQADNVYLEIMPVLNATKYQLQINQIIFNTTDLNVDITDYIVGGVNTIKVIAVGDEDIYLNSAEATTTYLALGIPANLKVQNGILSFDAVSEATSYDIVINESTTIVANNTTVDISTYISNPGVYQIKVRAVIDQKTGKFASIEHITTKQLDAPTNLSVSQINGSYTLSFDAVQNAQSYSVYVNNALACEISTNELDITSYLQLGENTVYVVAVGDEQVYLNSQNSQVVGCTLTKTLNNVGNLQVFAQTGSYYVSFDGVADAESYQVVINDSNSTNVFEKTILATELSNNSAQIDISSTIAYSDTYKVIVTAQSSASGVNSSTTTITQTLKSYSIDEYSQQYFYKGKDYTYAISSIEELENFVFYAVMYRLDSAEVYINFDYDGKDNAYTSTQSLIQNYLPTISKFGVDINQADVLGQLFGNMDNLSKLTEIFEFIERVHDQIYLYYDVTSELTSQKSNCVYTLNFSYVGDYEATLKNDSKNYPQANLPVSYTISQNTRTFAIDSLSSAPVETVAQLLMVLENGRKPEFVSTSKTADQLVSGKTIAEQTYLKAKEVLAQICTDQMTDYQKALAIYDWIITNNEYDNTTYDSALGTPFSSDNLSEMSFYASGMLLNNLAVCKGISQTFSLMCNIEGIKTLETFGIVGSGIDWANVDFSVSAKEIGMAMMGLSQNPQAIATANLLADFETVGAHSWNRVYLDAGEGEQWYIVDATWDDRVIDQTQYMSHEYFLVNEQKISTNRKEFYPYGQFYVEYDQNGQPIDYFANGNYNYHKDSTTKINTHITTQLDLDNVVANMLTNNLSGFEVWFDESIYANFGSMLQTAFANNSVASNNYNIKNWGNTVFVTIKN